jgi:hypothetical protein
VAVVGVTGVTGVTRDIHRVADRQNPRLRLVPFRNQRDLDW